MARHLKGEKIAPELVLCSPARRTRETLERVGPSGEVRIEDDLYGASATGLLGRLQEVPDEVESVMLIGHNPGLQDLALTLAPRATELAAKYPTGALATLQVSGSSWRELDRDTAELVDFVRPRDLE